MQSMDKPLIEIELVYATPEKQFLLAFSVSPGTTLGDGIEQSNIRSECPGLIIDPNAVGIFGRKVSTDHVLEAGDRIEIYRPLIADPKEVRREKAKSG